MAISLDKIARTAPSLLKNAEIAVRAIDKAALNGQTAQVAVMLDFSGSMGSDYRSGAMQRFAEKLLALGTQFDDDGDIDFFVFDSTAAHLGKVSINDFAGSVDRLIGRRNMGGTIYSKAFLTIRDHFGFAPPATTKKGLFGKLLAKAQPAQSGPADQPVYVMFLTDGSPQDPEEAKKALTEVSTAPMFFKFLSIGATKIPFLETLNTMQGRFIDNANYQHIGNTDTIDEAELFDKMLEEFKDWIGEARTLGLIK